MGSLLVARRYRFATGRDVESEPSSIDVVTTASPYEEERTPRKIHIPERQSDEGYVRPSRDAFTYVPDHAAELMA